MKIFSRYLIRNIFIGFAAAAGLLIPLFTTFNLMNELDDVSPGGYHWTQAVVVVLMTLPRSLIDLGPFIALLGGIVGLGQLSKSMELTAIRTTGFSIFRISIVALCAGLMLTVSLGAIDEWIASPLEPVSYTHLDRCFQLATSTLTIFALMFPMNGRIKVKRQCKGCLLLCVR